MIEDADQLHRGRGFAFTILPDWVASAEVSDRAVRVYALIARHANQGTAWPSRARLAEQAGCSIESVKRAVRELERIGALSREQRIGPNGEHRSNLYRINQLPDKPGRVVHKGGSQVTRGGVTGDPRGGSQVTHRTRPTRTRYARADDGPTNLWTDGTGKEYVSYG